jgi:hypothetical protein
MRAFFNGKAKFLRRAMSRRGWLVVRIGAGARLGMATDFGTGAGFCTGTATTALRASIGEVSNARSMKPCQRSLGLCFETVTHVSCCGAGGKEVIGFCVVEASAPMARSTMPK